LPDQTHYITRLFVFGSPDEFSFIKFLVSLGVVYQGDQNIKSTKQIIRTVEHRGEARNWEILEILEFDSTRKRMSVILREQATSRIVLYCKGAESFVVNKCIKGDVNQCLADIKRFVF
jgi:phospholipid-translocating ATPase